MSASPTDFDRYRSRPGNRWLSYAIPISAARVRRRIHTRFGSSLRRHEIGPSLFSAPGRACRTRHALRQRAHPAKDFPAFGEVIAEIGVILAIHLGVALAVTLALRMSGII